MTKKRKRRVLFLISSLNRGGAERQLVELVKGLDKSEFSCLVVTTHAQGAFAPELAGLPGVELRSLGKRGGLDVVGPVWRLLRLARAAGVDVVYAFEEGPGLLGVLVAARLGCRLVWGVRNTLSNAAKLGVRASVYCWLHRRLGRRADRIIYNSHRAECEYAQAGYPAAKGCTISNGFEAGRFTFDAGSRAELRRDWGVSDSTVVFAVVGSIKPDKNHPLALEAARLVGARIPSYRLAFVGRETPAHPILGPYAERLRNLARERGLESQLIWTGENADVARVLSAIDVLVLPSLREGTPNVVGEAMLCERPCIVADVGDAALLLGGNGTVFPPGDTAALAEAMVDWSLRSGAQRAEVGRAARQRIENVFSLQRMIAATAQLVAELSCVSEGKGRGRGEERT